MQRKARLAAFQRARVRLGLSVDTLADVQQEPANTFIRADAVRRRDGRDAPVRQYGLLHRIALRDENEGPRSVLAVPGFVPTLPNSVQQQPNVGIRHAVSDEKKRAAQGIGAKPDIEWRGAKGGGVGGRVW